MSVRPQIIVKISVGVMMLRVMDVADAYEIAVVVVVLAIRRYLPQKLCFIKTDW